jgi:DNA-binding response OmpR family regulator
MQDESQHNEVSMGSEEIPITVGPIGFDTSQWAVTVDGQLRRLTPVEYKILHFLAVHANQICTFNQIGSSVFSGYNDDGGYTTIIKSKICRIRSMIEPNPMHPIYLLTIPEGGYMLVSHGQDETEE